HGVNGNQVGTTANAIDPLLGPLANNGGPTPTHALLPGSPAVNGGVASGVSADQRGVPRQGTPDIGSVEFVPPSPPPAAPGPPAPPAPRPLTVLLANVRKGKQKLLKVRVLFADTGALRPEFLSPFPPPPRRPPAPPPAPACAARAPPPPPRPCCPPAAARRSSAAPSRFEPRGFVRGGLRRVTGCGGEPYACNPWMTISRNSRARRASASTPSGFAGRGTAGAKMFSQQSGIVRPVNANGASSR